VRLRFCGGACAAGSPTPACAVGCPSARAPTPAAYVPTPASFSAGRREQTSLLAEYGVCWWIELDVSEAEPGRYLFARRGDPQPSDGELRVYAVERAVTLSNALGSVPAYEGVRRSFCGVERPEDYPRACAQWVAQVADVGLQAFPDIAAEAARDGLLPAGSEFLPRIMCHVAVEEIPFARAVLMAQAEGHPGLVFLVVVAKSLFGAPGSCGDCAQCRLDRTEPS